MTEDGRLTVLVLAGQRDGKVDPLAAASGLSFKALAPVAGRPMILHVIEELASSSRVAKIVVSINADAELEKTPEIAAMVSSGRLTISHARLNLVDSVLGALEGAQFPALITTADNVLFSRESLAEIDIVARRAGADVAVGMARREAVLAAHPDGQRRFYRCADGEYSNCNAYWLGSRQALAPAELFRTGGQFVKHPMRVVQALGLGGAIEIIRFRFGLSRLDDSFARLSKRFRMKIIPVAMSDGAAAIDVDHERSRNVAEQVMAARGIGFGRAVAAE